ncbi:serine hydrolase family protein [Candidatus Woesearchaeota archaeon]|nr:serine hydrolase family protein [Candidatus Woesearchaeota archaeon]
MKTAFLIHGSYGSPKENWFPWLKEELQKLGYKVYAPQFPTPENQSLDSWGKAFQPFLGKINEETIFVGHSLGPAFILHILQNLHVEIRASFFVSSFISPLGIERFDSVNRTFYGQDFHWQAIKHHCRDFCLFHGEDDPYVPVEKAEELNSHLHGELILLEKGGHLNAESGFMEFQQLLEKIRALSAG